MMTGLRTSGIMGGKLTGSLGGNYAMSAPRLSMLSTPSSRLRRLCGVLAIALGLVATPIFTTEAVAQGSSPNGCTMAADSGVGFDFKSACDQHDTCYQLYWYGRSEKGRELCDSLFLVKMKENCTADQVIPLQDGCLKRAQRYYNAVRAVGKFWFDHSDILSRAETPIRTA